MSSQTDINNNITLLTFTVGNQTYGLPVVDVIRIIEMVTIIKLPGLPDSTQGVINVQGKAVPVMDLRQQFGLPPKVYGLHTPIILINIANDGGILGLIIDSVTEVLEINAEEMENIEVFVPTELLEDAAAQSSYLAGIAKVNRQMILVLKAQALLTSGKNSHLSQILRNANVELKA